MLASVQSRPVGVVEWDPTLPVETAATPDPLDALREFVPRRRVVPVEGMPRFTGGAVGALAYDAVMVQLPAVFVLIAPPTTEGAGWLDRTKTRLPNKNYGTALGDLGSFHRMAVPGTLPPELDSVEKLRILTGAFIRISVAPPDTDTVMVRGGTHQGVLLEGPHRELFRAVEAGLADSAEPGLVGGHCIGVDPYYLTYKAEETGYRPEIILAGRRLNDGMAEYVSGRIIKLMIRRNIQPAGARVLVLGLTFKENCPDVRNTKVADIVKELSSFGCRVDVHDPWADSKDAEHEYGIHLVANPARGSYDAIVVAVAHQQFVELGAKGIKAFANPNSVVFDIKHVLPKEASDGRL